MGVPPAAPLDPPQTAQYPAPTPHVPPSSVFGSAGQWVLLSTSNGAEISSRTFSGSSASFFNASGGIGIDKFVARNFSIGADVEAGYGDNKGYGATSLSETISTHLAAGVRLGANVPMGDRWSWYPRFTLGIASDHSDFQTVSTFSPFAPGAPASSTSDIGPWINLYAPLLLHPAPHFFVGIGPRFEHNFGTIHGGPYDRSQTSQWSGDVVVGGWWGDSEGIHSQPGGGPSVARFGARKQWVVTSATTLSIASYTYSSSDASRLNVTIAPGFDYFVADAVSIGVVVPIGYSSGTFFDSSGAQTDDSETVIGIAPRIGVNIPLPVDWLSIWSQAEIGYGVDDFRLSSALGANEHDSNRTWIQVSAPLLVHVAAHFFVGGGPFVFHELTDSDQNHVENDATTVGASFLLGGWL